MIVFVAKIHHFAKKKNSKKYGLGKLWKFFQKD